MLYATGPAYGPGHTPAVPDVSGVACEPGMADLSATSGLPLWLDRQHGQLVLAQPGYTMHVEPCSLRLVDDVLYDPPATAPDVVYWTFGDVALPADEGVFAEHGVHHNLLLLPAVRLGPEPAKTRGHVMICADGLECPEVYGVVHGRALFLLQQAMEEPAHAGRTVQLADVRLVEAEPGQKVAVPAAYGVVIVNPGSEPLVLSNLAAAAARPDPQLYQRMHGAAYFLTERDGAVALEPNRHYREPLPEAREDAPLHAPEMGIQDQVPLYSAFVHEPERFAWLAQGVPAVSGVG